MEDQFIQEDGTIKILSTTKSPVFNKADKTVGIIGVSKDITDNRIIEQRLAESELKYRTVVNSLKEVVFQSDSKGTVIFLNSAWENITHYAIEDSLGKNIIQFSHPEDSLLLTSLLEPLINGHKESSNFEFRLIDKNKQIHWIDVFISAIKEKDNSIKGFAGTLNDISNRKQMEYRINGLNSLHLLINEISSLLIQADYQNINNAINSSLEMLGQFAKVDRVYLFEFGDNISIMNNTFEWCSEGITKEIDNLQNIPCDMFSNWIEKFKANDYIYIQDVNELGDDRKNERDILEPQNIISLLTIPIYYGETLIGFIGFDSVRSRRIWEI